MKKVTLMLSEAMYNSLGLQNGASDDAIANAVSNQLQKAARVDALEDSNKKLKDEKDALQNKVDAMETAATKEKIDTLLNAAVDAGKLTNEAKEAYAEQFEKNPEGLEKVLNTMKPYAPVSNGLKGEEGKEETKQDLVNAYNKAFADGTLNDIMNTDYPRFQKLFKAKHGRDHKKKD